MNADTLTIDAPASVLLPGKLGGETPLPQAYGLSESIPGPRTSKEVLVIGDLHGHLDRFEALLRQEGLLDWCETCGGSGMIEIEPDELDERQFEECEVCVGFGWARTRRDEVEVILLGDVGHFGEGESATADMMTYQVADAWADIILWGNHDRAVVDSQHVFKGYLAPKSETRLIMGKLYTEKRLCLAVTRHGFLITHAGLHAAFNRQNVPDLLKDDVGAFVEWINQNDYPYALREPIDESAKAIRDAISHKRGGWAPFGGILWRDINEKLYTPGSHWGRGFRQVFGHTASKTHEVHTCGYNMHTTAIMSKADKPSYCIDIGGKGDLPSGNCLAGIWLPQEKIVRVDL